jgi:hypothetical protein
MFWRANYLKNSWQELDIPQRNGEARCFGGGQPGLHVPGVRVE